MTDEELAAVRALVERMKTGMLSTVDPQGGLRSRPMYTLELDHDARLWFFTSVTSAKVEEIAREHAQVGLSYADLGKQDYVSITGRGEIVRDRERIKSLWSAWAKPWFPNGVDDPDLALLCVRIDQAEYWDAPGSMVKRLYALAKGAATGDTSAFGEHRKVAAR